jgi:hypothetical protein
MRLRARAPLILGWSWLAFAAAVTVIYRGLTQSLTIDEAYTYHLFLNQKAAVLFHQYDAAYHVLHTWACWLAVHKFGKSEAIIRLPGMLAALFYLAGSGRLTRRLVGDGSRFPVGTVLLSANPLLADYLSAARGYGPALAFFVWAFDALLQGRVVRAGVLMALSVSCNLTFLIPVAAAGGVYLIFQAFQRKRVIAMAGRMALPFLAIAVPVLAIPLRHASGSQYYYGARDLAMSIQTLAAPSLAYAERTCPNWARVTAQTVLPVLMAGIVLAGVLAMKRRALPAVLASGSLTGSVLLLIAAHVCLGVLYPWTRTGLYLIWLFLVCCLALWEWPARWISIPFGAASVLLAAAFLAQFDTRYYYDFRDDAPVSAMMRRLRDLHPVAPACIGGSWYFEPTVNYYRLRYRLTWLEEMKRTDEPLAGCRFYILRSGDARYADQLGLHRLWTDPVSGTILAEAVTQ